jgi:hypothetical protein
MTAKDNEKWWSGFSLCMLVLGVGSTFGYVFICDQGVCFGCFFWCKTCQLLQHGFFVILSLCYDSFSVWGSGVDLLCLLVTWFINSYKCVLHK